MKTLGSLFAGIGGFDYGFEQAGWTTKWQVEQNPIHRLVLAERFAGATQYEDVCAVGAHNLEQVDCITAGFPCQDISIMGAARKSGVNGLAGQRSGLFWQVIRILREIQPPWVVLENVTHLLAVNDCQDIQTVITALAQCGYVGYFRVLNAQYFGVPQNRRRVFLVAGLGRYPSPTFLADAGTVEAVPITLGQEQLARHADSHAANTYTAKNTTGRISLGSEILIAEENGWREMAEWGRKSSVHGLPTGLDNSNLYQCYAAGNAVVPAVARWIAETLNQS